MKGRKGKPLRLKVLMGNPGHQNLKDRNEPDPPHEMPDVPEWLKKYPDAIVEWEREGKILFDLGVLTIADAGVLATRSYVYSQIIMEAKRLDKIRGRKNFITMKALITEHRQLGSLLGLDPASRTKLDTGKLKKKNKFEGLIGAQKKSQG